MKKLILLAAGLCLALSVQAETPAAGNCEARAVSKAGKPLAGAAKAKFMKKCEADSKPAMGQSDCAAKAVGSNGKPLAGAAKAKFIKKCEAAGK